LDDFDLLKVIGKGSFGKVSWRRRFVSMVVVSNMHARARARAQVIQVAKKDTGKIYAMKVLNKKTIIERNEMEHTKSVRVIVLPDA
jgi:hypothetical protein